MLRVSRRFVGLSVAAAIGAAVGAVVPARAHHSFAGYNMGVTKVFTGVVTRVNPDANHLQIFFAPMNENRKNVLRDAAGNPVVWAVEMAGSAQMAREGITVSSFPPGTIFSVGLHPLRDGQPAGTRGPTGAIYKCPWRKPPPPGKHCDVVEGSAVFGKGGLLNPTG
ncbi:MAG TPA: DUF6152 family protein [Steroidobacteraceae bacterium]|nr:DUF6152 family protein [Steroidobacteraceae bacterium]